TGSTAGDSWRWPPPHIPEDSSLADLLRGYGRFETPRKFLELNRLVADNVAFKDADAFNRAIADHPDWRSVSLLSYLPLHSPEHDALCLALRL
ncbi:MAG: hypothetical protein JRF38_14980, partial [Deltaproteobacteria bacterium]|nr:hypothetical protein [Deltaproteobacteria bacterium]